MQLALKKNLRNALIIPEEALIANGSDNFVLIADESEEKVMAKKVKVTLGVRKFGEVEILDGLSQGDKVIIHGTLRVRPDAEISIKAVEEDNEPLKDLLIDK